MPLVHLMQLVLNSLHELPYDEIFVNEDEEEAFEESVCVEEPEGGHSNEDLCDEIAEELCFIHHVFIQFGHFLKHVNVGSTF
jgi:hypothetical protein